MAEYNLGTASGRIVVDGSGASEGFNVARAAAESFFGAIESQIESVDQLGTNLLKLGAVTSAGFGVAVAAASGFEAGLSAIEAVSGATEAQMEAVRATALRLGADTKFSASEAASAIEELVKAGISVDDAINGAADATVALAAAGEIALPRAAEIAANAMNVFNLSASDMPKVADLIAGAANASAITVEQFGQSLSASGAAANLAGIEFDGLSTAIALMGNAGIKGSDAGTSLKTMLLNLNPVTDRQTNLMKKLGLITADGANQFFDAEGKAKSFAEIAGVLQRALEGQTQQQKLATLETLFGADAIRAAAIVSEAGTKGFEDMAAAMGKVTAESVAATRMDNLRGSIEQLKGSLETAAIIIGEFFLPALRRMADLATAVVNVFNSAPPGVQAFLVRVVALGGALATLTGIGIKLLFFLAPLLAKFLGFMALKQVFSIFTQGFTVLRSGLGPMAAMSVMVGRTMTVFGRFGTVLKGVFGFLKTLPGVLGALRVAVGFLFGPWGAAIALVSVALGILYNKWQPFHDLVNRVAGAIKTGLIAALDAAKRAWTLFVNAFTSGMTEDEGTWVESIALALRSLWQVALQVAAAFRSSVLPALQQAAATLGPVFVDAWRQISDAVKGSLLPALQQLGTALAPLLPYLQQFGMFLLKLVGTVLAVAGIIVGALVFGLLKLAQIFVTYVLPAIIQFVTFLVANVVPVIATVIAAIVQFVAAAVSFVAGFIQMWQGAQTASSGAAVALFGILTSIQTFFVTVWTAISTFVMGVLTAIAAFFVGIWLQIQAGITAFIAFVTGIWNAFWGSLFGQVVLNALGLVLDFIKLNLALIQYVVSAFIAFVKLTWQAGWNAVRTAAATVWNGITSTVRTAIGVVRAIVTTVMAAIVSRIQSAWNTARAVTSAVVNAIRSVVTSVWNAIRSATAAAWTAIYSRISGPLQQAYATVMARTAGIRAAIASAWNAVRSATSAAWNAFATSVSTGVSRAMAVVRSIHGQVVGALSGAASWLYQAGVNIIQGLLNGINSMISSVRAKLQELTSIIPDSKGPPSRDKILLEENGKLIMQGLIRGLQSEEGALISELSRLTGLIPAAAGATTTTNNANVSVTMPGGADPYAVGEVTAQRILAKSRR
jgi:TP901 family phage tail tape measure protein